MSRHTIILSLFIVLLAACSKKDKPQPGTTYNYTSTIKVRNHMDDAINLAFYKTRNDYIHNINPIATAHIAVGDVYSATFTNAADSVLYYDWYTDDHLYSNWGQNHYFNAIILLKGTAGDTDVTVRYGYDYWTALANKAGDSLVIEPYYNYDYGMRDYLIHFNKVETKWRCVYCYFYNGTLDWKTAPDWQKDMRMTIRKDQQYFFTGFDAYATPLDIEGGITRFQPVTDQFTPGTWYIQNWNNNKSNASYIRVRHHPAGTDTLEVQYSNGYYYFTEE